MLTDTEYLVKVRVTLEPVGQPWVSVGFEDWKKTQQLTTTTMFEFEFDADYNCVLEVEHFDKADTDATTAVIIKDISFFDISDPKFVWSGVYHPNYPDHYVDKVTPLPGQGYLGWNGVYRLEFSVPVFTWMHRTMNLGWIYQ